MTGLEDRQKGTWFLTPWLTGLEKECRKPRLALCGVAPLRSEQGKQFKPVVELGKKKKFDGRTVYVTETCFGCVSLLDFSRECYAAITLFMTY